MLQGQWGNWSSSNIYWALLGVSRASSFKHDIYYSDHSCVVLLFSDFLVPNSWSLSKDEKPLDVNEVDIPDRLQDSKELSSSSGGWVSYHPPSLIHYVYQQASKPELRRK